LRVSRDDNANSQARTSVFKISQRNIDAPDFARMLLKYFINGSFYGIDFICFVCINGFGLLYISPGFAPNLQYSLNLFVLQDSN